MSAIILAEKYVLSINTVCYINILMHLDRHTRMIIMKICV